MMTALVMLPVRLLHLLLLTVFEALSPLLLLAVIVLRLLPVIAIRVAASVRLYVTASIVIAVTAFIIGLLFVHASSHAIIVLHVGFVLIAIAIFIAIIAAIVHLSLMIISHADAAI
jgi:hypothetical protein